MVREGYDVYIGMDYSLIGVDSATNTTVSPFSLAGCAPYPVVRCPSLSRFTYNSSIGVVSYQGQKVRL